MGGWPRRLSMGWEPQRHLSAQLSTTRCFRLFPHGSAAWIAPPWRPFETLILPHYLFIPGRVIYLFIYFFWIYLFVWQKYFLLWPLVALLRLLLQLLLGWIIQSRISLFFCLDFLNFFEEGGGRNLSSCRNAGLEGHAHLHIIYMWWLFDMKHWDFPMISCFSFLFIHIYFPFFISSFDFLFFIADQRN